MKHASLRQFGRALVKHALSIGAELAAAARWRAAARGPRIHFLGYHRVVDRVELDGPVNPALCISTASFQRQMEQARRRFTMLSLDDAMRAIDGSLALDRDACTITFDDGYRDVLLRAHPILSGLGIPAAVFVPSGFVGSTKLLTHDRLYGGLRVHQRRGQKLELPPAARAEWPRVAAALAADGPAGAVETAIVALPAAALSAIADALEARYGALRLDGGARVLAKTELRALADAGWEIGAHTIGHTVLTHEPRERIRDELTESKRELEKWSGRPCRYFAYCNGYHSHVVVEELQRAGFEGAVTTCDRPNVPRGDRMRASRKVLWQAHAEGAFGGWSSAVSAAHLHDLFGSLGLTRPVDGEVLAEVTW